MSPTRGFSLVLALALLAVPGSSAAQVERPNSLVPGRWALVFRVGPEFQLSTFRGGTIGAKWQTSENAAWRGSIDLGALNRHADEESSPPDSAFDGRIYDESSYDIRLSVERQWYLSTGKDVNAYWTLGPRIGWASFETSDQSAVRDTEALSLRLGAELGGEWFAARRLSFSAAYAASFGWTREERSIDYGDFVDNFELESWNLASEGAWLGLNVYF